MLLGLYVEEGWNEPAARVLLIKLGVSESVVMPYQAYRCKLPLSPTQEDPLDFRYLPGYHFLIYRYAHPGLDRQSGGYEVLSSGQGKDD